MLKEWSEKKTIKIRVFNVFFSAVYNPFNDTPEHKKQWAASLNNIRYLAFFFFRFDYNNMYPKKNLTYCLEE